MTRIARHACWHRLMQHIQYLNAHNATLAFLLLGILSVPQYFLDGFNSYSRPIVIDPSVIFLLAMGGGSRKGSVAAIEILLSAAVVVVVA